MEKKHDDTPTLNKPINYMAENVITQTSVLQKNDSDYPLCSLSDAAT